MPTPPQLSVTPQIQVLEVGGVIGRGFRAARFYPLSSGSTLAFALDHSPKLRVGPVWLVKSP